MVGYVTLGSNELERAVAFYDELLSQFGAKQAINDGRMVVWAAEGGGAMLAVCTPYDEKQATVGNGTMVALAGGSQEGVKKLHARALELGASDEGGPAPRTGAFYGAYFRDLDGNKLCVFHIG